MFQVGPHTIALINDGDIRVDPGGAYGVVPRVLWSRYSPPDDNHMIGMTLTCLLVRTGGHIVVVDAGLGTKLTDKAQRLWGLQRLHGGLLDGLARLGVMPEQVDTVICTHLHADHAGGLTRYDEGGALVPTFPNARHVVFARELDDARHPNARTRATYLAENVDPLVARGLLDALPLAETELVPGVFGVPTPGHTPGHMSVRVDGGNGQHALFTCDMTSYAVHMERLAWVTAYDVEPLVTLETKRHWQAWAVQHNALVIVPHDTARHAGHLVADGQGGLQFVPVPVTFA